MVGDEVVGWVVGLAVGSEVGSAVGEGLGAKEGLAVGAAVGEEDGAGVGANVGLNDGLGLGAEEGPGVGADVGAELGDGVGAEVGTAEGGSVHPSCTHGSVSANTGHSTPLFCAVSITSRDLVEVVVLQGPSLAPHADQASHSVTMQSIGHAGFCKHCPSSISCPQDCPPCSGSDSIVRVRVFFPIPQLVVQPPQPSQLVITQFIGQSSELQTINSEVSGQGAPVPAT